MPRALHQLIHLGCCVDRQGMLRGARARSDKVGHGSDLLKLRIACLRQQTEHNVFKSDHPNTQLDQLGIRKLGEYPLPRKQRRALPGGRMAMLRLRLPSGTALCPSFF